MKSAYSSLVWPPNQPGVRTLPGGNQIFQLLTDMGQVAA